MTIYNSLGFPYRKHIGSPITGITLRADPCYRREPAFHYVAVR